MTQGTEESSAVSTTPPSSSSYPGGGLGGLGGLDDSSDPGPRSPDDEEEETEAPKPPSSSPSSPDEEERDAGSLCYGSGSLEEKQKEKEEQHHAATAAAVPPGIKDEEDFDDEEDRESAAGPLGLACCLGATTCCVCMEAGPVSGCLRSEKLCLLPIVACLLSLALCTAGLKWVFVDRIFEYDPPSAHNLDPKRPLGQESDPIVILADPTRGLAFHNNTTSTSPPIINATEVVTPSPVLTHPLATQSGKAAPPPPKRTPPTEETNDIVVNTISATSTTLAAKTSSHVTRCSDSQKNFCVNGGECFTLEVTPGSTKFLCRCPNEFTGDRCQNYVMTSFYKNLGIEFMEAEELYQKRVLTISGICLALLVVGVMCVVAYCKTKKQRKKLHDRLRQSLRNGRGNTTGGVANGPPTSAFENVTLVNQHAAPTDPALATQHDVEKETETSFTLEQPPNMEEHNPSQSKRHSHPPIQPPSSLMPPTDIGPHTAAGSHRGRLNATGGTSDLCSSGKSNREAPSGYRDTTYSERYMFAVTTPDSPPSEMSAPLSDRSAAMSLSGEWDERPLISSGPVCSCSRRNSCQVHKRLKRNSAHFNLGLDLSGSPPASPPLAAAKQDYQIAREHGTVAESDRPDASDVLANGGVGGSADLVDKSQNPSDQEGSDGASSGSASEAEDTGASAGGARGPDAPALAPDATATAPPLSGGGWTESLRLSESGELQSRLPSIHTNQQQPIAV